MTSELERFAAARMQGPGPTREETIARVARDLAEARGSARGVVVFLAVVVALLGAGALGVTSWVAWDAAHDPELGAGAVLALSLGTLTFGLLLALGPALALAHQHRLVRDRYPVDRSPLERTGVRGRAILTRYVPGRATLRYGTVRYAIDRAYFAVEANGPPYEVLLHVVAELHARPVRSAEGVVVLQMPEPGEAFEVFVDPRRPAEVHLPPRR